MLVSTDKFIVFLYATLDISKDFSMFVEIWVHHDIHLLRYYIHKSAALHKPCWMQLHVFFCSQKYKEFHTNESIH